MALTPTDKRAGSDEAFLREVDDAVRASDLTGFWKRYGRWLLASGLYSLTLGYASPRSFFAVAPDSWPGDPVIGQRLMAGQLVARYVDLRGEHGSAAGAHPHVQMRWPPAVGHRPDRLERIAALGVRGRDAIALEVVVARFTGVADVVIAAMHVALPKLDGCARDRRSVPRENTAAARANCLASLSR